MSAQLRTTRYVAGGLQGLGWCAFCGFFTRIGVFREDRVRAVWATTPAWRHMRLVHLCEHCTAELPKGAHFIQFRGGMA